MSVKYLCNLVVPGAAKSGTSSLHEALHRHPKICMCKNEIKEPHYFCRSDVYTRGNSFHNSLFEPEGEVEFFGESSTGYMIWPDAIERIARDLTNPKIILLLRHPVSRTISHWRWRVRLGLENRPLMEAVESDGHGYDPEKPHNGYGYAAYLQFSEYSKYRPMWVEKFGEMNCLTITTDELESNFQNTMSRCFSFLQVDDFKFEGDVRANENINVVARPKPFMTRMVSPLPADLKVTSLYKNIRASILKASTSKKMIEVSECDKKAVELLLKEEIKYFDSIER